MKTLVLLGVSAASPLELIVVDATRGSHPPLPELPTLTRARSSTPDDACCGPRPPTWASVMPKVNGSGFSTTTTSSSRRTSGTGIGLNSHNRNEHLRYQDIVRRRYQRERDEAWAAHFARLATRASRCSAPAIPATSSRSTRR